MFTGDRLLYTKLKDSDSLEIVKGLNDSEVSRYLPNVPHPYTYKDFMEWYNKPIDNDILEQLVLVISACNTMKFMGVNHLRIKRNYTAVGGIWLLKEFWANGYGKEAMSWKLNYAFSNYNVTRYYSGYMNGNERSRKMQENLGFIKDESESTQDRTTTFISREVWLK
jgi:RimJ/RimL family protein N-acetyltransferase